MPRAAPPIVSESQCTDRYVRSHAITTATTKTCAAPSHALPLYASTTATAVASTVAEETCPDGNESPVTAVSCCGGRGRSTRYLVTLVAMRTSTTATSTNAAGARSRRYSHQ